jgi:hypothetical protein
MKSNLWADGANIINKNKNYTTLKHFPLLTLILVEVLH